MVFIDVGVLLFVVGVAVDGVRCWSLFVVGCVLFAVCWLVFVVGVVVQ